ncbi:hypothetical protein BU23DRAFT_472995, partial [Bimuria novae-zelandiae CBS 107.79]
GVRLLIHLGRSPDLNPTEGCWLILKEKAKRRLHKPCEGETPWDRTTKHLKDILRQIWDEISINEIRELIEEMPDRCQRLIETGGEKIRSQRW